MRTGPGRILAPCSLALILGCGAPAENSPPEPPNSPPGEPSPRAIEQIGLGNGFLVWESNRNGRWRIWIRDLAGGEARQLSPNEGRNLHCCPHISPDGERIVYLSLAPDQKGYPRGGAVGVMMWIRPDGSDVESVLPAARNYYENRAAVWRSPSELIYLQQDGRTALLDLDSRSSSLLTREPDENGPWLVNSKLTWAASGNGALAPFLKNRQTVASRTPRPGCQPYFSHDGRWGFWVVAPGGPIDRLQLASETRSSWLKKSDPRLHDDFGYLYFPMLSADGRLLAFAASDDDHPHFEADYEVFVVETDPRTLAILGTPRRFTHNPATDRFPDVHLAPLPLGRHYGEAPFRWTADPGSSDVRWHWTYGDGSSSTGPTGEHLFEDPGRFHIVATVGEQTLTGLLSLAAAAPPQILSSSLRHHGTKIVVVFDEAIETSQMISRLASATPIAGHTIEDDGHRLALQLAKPLHAADTLHLSGITDRAQTPNRLGATQIEIEPAVWPAYREGLVFLWETGDAPNLLFDPELGAETAVTLTAKGTARFDSAFAMQPAGGHYEVPESASNRICLECKRTYEISIEMVLAPAPLQNRRGVILTSASGSRRNFTLEQQGRGLYLGLRMRSRGDEAFPRAFLVDLPSAQRSHVVVTYSPGELEVYLDGESMTTESSFSGGFFHWRTAPLVFGSDRNGRNPWRGTLEGVAIYARALAAEEVRESFSRYRAKLDLRPQIPTWTVRAKLDVCSAKPTLQMIDPYREALVTCRYRVDDVIAGNELGAEVRVAHWSMMDGRQLGLDPGGTTSELQLTLFEDNPQLASIYLSDTLEPPVEGPLFYLQTP